MNIFRYSILAIRKAGPFRFAIIVAAKIYRLMTRGAALRSIRHVQPPAFARDGFTGVLPLDRSTASRFRKEFPEAFPTLLACAQKIRAHEFEVFGRSLKFEGVVLWHTDPLTNKEWQKKSYSEISLHYDGSPTDPKPVWELSRHQHFVTLAQASYLSGDRTFFDELISEWLHWIDDNPCGVGINWASPLELGVRLISWTLAFQFVEPLLSARQRELIAQSVWQHCAFLASHLSTDKIVRTNHLIGECAGLLVAAMSFRFPESERWSLKGSRILENEIFTQIHSDGGAKEQSASYHRFDVDFFLLSHLVTRKTSRAFSEAFSDRLQTMIRWLELVLTPDGTLPPFGDFDNGRGFMLAPTIGFWKAAGSVGSALAINESYLPLDTPPPNEETFWLLTEKEWTTLRSLKQGQGRKTRVLLRESGHVIIRDERQTGGDYCFFRAGEFGMGGGGFSYHSHNDLFSPIVYLNGVPILADTGTSVYLGSDADRDYLRSSAAHNTTFAASWNLFRTRRGLGWIKIADGEVRQTSAGTDEAVFECQYSARHIPYKRIFSRTSAGLRIEDVFTQTTEGVHSYFHLAEGLTARPGKNFVDIMKNSTTVALLTFTEGLSLQVEKGWLSKSFGSKVDAQILHYSWKAIASAPAQFTLSAPRPNSGK